MDPAYSMMLESFIQLAREQDQSVLDGAVMVFLPVDGTPSNATLFAWVSEETDRKAQSLWHDTFVAMLFALLAAGVDSDALHELVEFAKNNADNVAAEEHEPLFSDKDEIN